MSMTSSQISSAPTDPWQDLLDLCDPLVLHAPKTWGDPLRSSQMQEPEGIKAVVLYVRNNLLGCPWLNHLVLLAAVLSSQNVQCKTLLGYLSGLHCGLSELFGALDLQSMDQWEVDKHLSLYLNGQVLSENTSSQRIVFWRLYCAGSRHLKRWLSSLPNDQQECYRCYVLSYPDDPHELTRLSGERRHHYEQQEKRKEDTDAIMPFYADLRTQAHLRYNLLVRLRKAYHKAIEAVEQGKAHLPFEFEMTEGGTRQEHRSPTERLVFKLWDRRTFILAHPDHFSYTIKWDARNHMRSYSDEKNSYLLEFVKVESLDGAAAQVGLWFLELLEKDVLGSAPMWGSTQEIAEKRAWLQEQGYGEDEKGAEFLTPFKTCTPGILFPSKASGDGEFMRNAHERIGTLFIPIEPFWVAATFGMVTLHILTANGMRIGELHQLRASPDCIIPITLAPAPDATDRTPSVHWAVRAVPTAHRVSALYYRVDELLRLLALIKLMLCEHYHIDPKAGEDLPIVPMRGNHRHRFPPDRYLFQYSHKGFHEDDTRAVLRFLMHGLVFQTLDERRVTIRPHLLRHGFATWALNVAKEPVDIVARILNQNNLEVTKYYGRPNPRLIAERSHGLMKQISSYIDVEDLILRSPEELRAFI